MKLWIKLIVIGVISGFILGEFFKFIQHVTGKGVYTLLLNVDYIPVLQDLPRTEGMEFFLHLIVSTLLIILLFLWINNKNIHRIFTWCVTICSLIGIILYPTTVFSVRTPELVEVVAFSYWVSGHIIYGVIVGVLLGQLHKESHKGMDRL
ncbi:hypothetical protein [Oceanobacillus salinisoli]|uniref:hypothetical protein n=1 Tax=Oceanobacillus salinisoli TaxID=2678611 RepID=UPI0012E1AB8D|nr:hypothetical protein [Oceanobacillus salinisoli]